jgi:hypothetical protein
VRDAFLEESFDRKAFWICRRYPELADLLELPETISGGSSPEEVRHWDNQRLDKSMEHCVLNGGVLVFGIYFASTWRKVVTTSSESSLTLLSGSSNSEKQKNDQTELEAVATAYDRFYGRPSSKWLTAFRKEVGEIHSMKDWPTYFEKLRTPYQGDEWLLHWLRRSLRNSRRKRYHDENTDFFAAQQRISSNILLRGASNGRVCLVIDCSGSMNMIMNDPELGMLSRLDFIKDQVCQVLDSLNPNQTFSVISFNDSAVPLFAGFLQASPRNIDTATDRIYSWEAEGETNLFAALEAAYRLPNLNAVYLLSDGEPTVGTTDKAKILESVDRWSRVSSVNTDSAGPHNCCRVPCHPTALMTSQACTDLLADIAQITGGELLERQ